MNSRLIRVFVLSAICLAGAGGLFFHSALAGVIALVVAVAAFALARISGAASEVNARPAPASPKTQNQRTASVLEATLDSMREGVLVVDGGLRVVLSNRKAREMFGTGPSPLESRRLSELIRSVPAHDAFAHATVSGESQRVRVEPDAVTGRIFELHVSPLGFPGAAAGRGAIGVFSDITEIEQLETVRQEFLSNVSHELRTPLTSIIAYTETLEEGAVDDSANRSRFLGVIRKNASRMHKLIDDILELSAIESGAIRLQPQSVPLAAVAEEIAASLTAQASARNVRIEVSIASDAEVYADPARLEQMLTNLIENAIKFNREGGAVTVSHEREEKDSIHVADTGEGIAPEHLPRIFERFYRTDRARSREMGGTGLGLAIVKHLALAHGGGARVQSELGRGAVFTIELPLHAAITSKE